MDDLTSMEDNSFERFIAGKDADPIIPSGLHMRVHWLQQLHLYTEYLSNRTAENLKKVFTLFGEQANLLSLHINKDAAIPFSGEWFSRVKLGRNVTIRPEVILMAHGGITLGDGAIVGQSAMLITVGHPIHPTQRHLQTRGPINVDRNALIGSDAMVVNSGKVEPTTIGEGSIILPGAIVTKDIPPYSLVDGVNKILLQGKQYFLPLDDGQTEETLSLTARLSPQGLETLPPSLDKNTGLAAASQKALPVGTQVYMGKSPEERYSFFKGSDRFDLDTCIIHAPVYVTGETPVILTGMILNRGSSMNTAAGGKIIFSKGTLLAPKASLKVEESGKLIFEEITWVGAGAEIVVPKDKTVTIGKGSVLAAGARVVGQDVPPMSLVVGEGKIVRTIGDQDISPVPPQWMDIPRYRQYHVDIMKQGQDMGPDGRQTIINNLFKQRKALGL